MHRFYSKSNPDSYAQVIGSVLKNVFMICLFFSFFTSISAQQGLSPKGDDPSMKGNEKIACPMSLTPEELKPIIARDAQRIKEGKNVAKSLVRNVPVKIHIVRRSNGTGGLAAASAAADIAQANINYTTAGFHFFQCGPINYINNNTFFNLISRSLSAPSTEYTMANANKVSDALNVFYCPSTSPNTSWSSFPFYLDDYGKDWIIMNNGHSNNGSTFSHEVGHWFDLYHTHQGNETVTRNSSAACYNCATNGDLLCDTPADRGTNFTTSCTYNGTAVNPCDGLAYAPLPTNIMSYARQTCRTSFTAGQINRMQLSYDADRKEIHNANCSNVCIKPTINQNATNLIYQTTARLNCSTPGTRRDFKYRPSTTATWTHVISTTSTFKNLSGLTPNTTYYWVSKVRCNNGMWSSWSPVETFKTKSTCATPTAFQNYTNGITEIAARLNCSAAGTFRDFRYRASSSSTWKHVSYTSTNYKFISGLTPGTSYIWQSAVRCTNGSWSDWSTNEYFTTSSGICNAPLKTQNYTNVVKTNSARLNCSASGSHRDFRYRPSWSSIWKNVTHTTANHKNINGLSSNTTYYWQSAVKCHNGKWSTWSANEVFTTASSLTSEGAEAFDQETNQQLTHEGLAVSVAPNPQMIGLETDLVVDSATGGASMVLITDISGKTMMRKELVLEQGSNRIQLDGFEQSGIYLISVQNGVETVTSKLIIVE